MIRWTTHALDRLHQRFGNEPWRSVPISKIERKVASVPDENYFRVRGGIVVYVCKAISGDALIITLYRFSKKKSGECLTMD